jgi:type IV secretory pathway TrbD component
VLESNANDSLVALSCVGALLAFTMARRELSGVCRGIAIALGAAAKFVPLALAPLFARRAPVLFGAALVLVTAAVVLPFVPDGGLREMYDRTVGYQISRPSPFSIWGQAESLDWLQLAVKVGAAGLAALVAFLPRRVGPREIAALGGAVLIALQLTAGHWFYLYVVWFVPFVLVALFAAQQPVTTARPRVPEPERELVPA